MALFLPPTQDPHHQKFLETLVRNIVMAGLVAEADIVHGHTWYSQLAGCLLKPLLGARLVLTTHSLEPHRPWKVEQLGTAYHASSWVERTAYQNADGVIAVSEAMKKDVHDLYGVPLEKTRVIHVIPLYTHALIFVCPSVYEPFGTTNLEATACETPVVAAAVGGIPEVVVHGETGLLVSFEPVGAHDFEPKEPEQFSRDLAAAVNRLLNDPVTMWEMSGKARERVEQYCSGTSIAQRTLDFYHELTKA